VTSTDLATWRRHRKPALAPGPAGTNDADGCFSGCAHASGLIMYTGVVRRPREEVEEDEKRDGAGAPGQRETQMIAVVEIACDSDGDGAEAAAGAPPTTLSWRKRPQPPDEGGDGQGGFLPRPPMSLGPLTGWRDPFLVHHGGGGEKDEEEAPVLPRWLLVGSGLRRQQAGTATLYRRRDGDGAADDGPALARGWEYHALLATDPSCTIWECPMLLALPPHPEDEDEGEEAGGGGAAAAGAKKNTKTTWLLSASPDYCANVSEYWLGSFDAAGTGAFVPQGAVEEEDDDKGGDDGDGPPKPPCLGLHPPMLLDLGDILYAPNVLLPPLAAAVSSASASSSPSAAAATTNAANAAAVSGRAAPVMWAWAQERGRPEMIEGAEAGGGGPEDQEAGGNSNSKSMRTYSCCLTAPRLLFARPSLTQPGTARLWQEPLPELAKLRVPLGSEGGGVWPALPLRAEASFSSSSSCSASSCALPLPLPRRAAAHADVELTLRLSPGCTGFALLLRPLSFDSNKHSQGLALTFDLKTCAFAAVHGGAWRAPEKALAALAALPAPKPRRVLHPPDNSVERARDQELASRAAAEAEEDGAVAVGGVGAEGGGGGGGGDAAATAQGEEWRRTGGTLDLPPGGARELSLRLLLDGSLVEVFCLSSGQALATRCYRCGSDEDQAEEEGGGEDADGRDAADAERAPLALLAFGSGEEGAAVEVVRGASYAMRSCFFDDEEEDQEEEEEDADWERVEAPEEAAAATATATLSLGGGGGAADKAR
jgi:hypothetical protein